MDILVWYFFKLVLTIIKYIFFTKIIISIKNFVFTEVNKRYINRKFYLDRQNFFKTIVFFSLIIMLKNSMHETWTFFYV